MNLPDSDISRTYDAPFRAQLAQGKVILIAQLVENALGEPDVMGPPQEHILMLPNQSEFLIILWHKLHEIMVQITG